MKVFIAAGAGSELFRKASGTRQSLHPRPRDLGTGLSVWDDKDEMRAYLRRVAAEAGREPPKANDPVTVIETKRLSGLRLDHDLTLAHHYFLTPVEGSLADWIDSDPDHNTLTEAIWDAKLRVERLG